MRWHARILLAVSIGTAAACSSGEQPIAEDSTAVEYLLTERGIGPLSVGMSVSEAERLVGSLTYAGGDTLQCRMTSWPGAPAGVRVMIEGNRLVRFDVDSGSTATREGARIGDPESRIMELYPGRVTSGPHKYVEGHYLTVRPANPADSTLRMIFETDGRVVTRFQSGQVPQVEYVEHCG